MNIDCTESFNKIDSKILAAKTEMNSPPYNNRWDCARINSNIQEIKNVKHKQLQFPRLHATIVATHLQILHKIVNLRSEMGS